MAIKDQCTRCISFSEGLCKIQSSSPSYDQTSCSQYTKKGINLDKHEGQLIHNDTYENRETTHSHQTDTPMKQRMFQHPFSFNGRIRRMEYGLSYIIVYIYAIFVGFVVGGLGGDEAVMHIILIPAYWFIWAQGAKRCHDRGNSGWYQLIPFYVLWMLFGDGDVCENDYGTDPKGRRL